MKAALEIFRPLIYASLSVLCLCAAFGAFEEGAGLPTPWSWFQPAEPAPFDTDGTTFLVVYDDASFAQLPREQQQIINGQELREWAEAHCYKEGDVPAYRVWDKDVDLSKSDESQMWKDALEKAKAKGIPALVVANERGKGDVIALPANVDGTIKVLNRFTK